MTNRLALLLISTVLCLAHYSPALAQTGKVVLRTRSAVSAAAYSPDGKILAAAYSDRTIRLWDTSTHKLLATLQNDKYHVISLAFSPDGKTLATGGRETVILWNVSTGKPKIKLKSTANPRVKRGELPHVTTLAFSPDGMTLAMGEYQVEQVRLWDVKTGNVKDTFPLHGKSLTATAVAFSPDGNTLAVGSAPPPPGRGQAQLPGGVQLWDLTTKKKKGVLFGDVSCIAFSRDGTTLALGHRGVASLYNALTGQPKGEAIGEPIKEDSGQVFSIFQKTKLAFSPNTKLLATAYEQVQLWDLTNGKKLWSFKNGDVPFSAVAISPDGKSLACGRYDGLLELWNYETKKQIATLNDIKSEAVGGIRQMVVTPDGKTVAVYLAVNLANGSNLQSSTCLVDVSTGEVKARITDRLDGPVFSPDAKFLAGWDYGERNIRPGNIQLWDVQTGKQRWKFNITNGSHYDVLRFSPDSSIVAASAMQLRRINYSLRSLLLDAKSGKEITSVTPLGKGKDALVVKFSSDGKRLAIALPGSVEIWDLSTNKRTGVFSTGVFSERFQREFELNWLLSPDFKLRARSGLISRDDPRGYIEIWDIASGKKIATFICKKSGMHSLTFSPDGKMLLSRNISRKITEIWDIANGKRIATLDSLLRGTLAFSPDGKILVFGGPTIRLWDIRKQKEIANLKGHTAPITFLAFIHEGKTLASGSGDHTVRYWDVSAFVK